MVPNFNLNGLLKTILIIAIILIALAFGVGYWIG